MSLARVGELAAGGSRAGTKAVLLAAPLICAAHATTKGLSQIVTPDLQPVGQLSLSFQAQDRQIDNPYQLQGELGVTPWLEIAAFQGLSPNEQILGTEVGLVQRLPYLLSAGLINWSTRGTNPQPFLEGGYYTTHDKWMGGPIRVHDRTRWLAGWAHDFNDRWRAQIDYQSGRDNYFTVGFTCNVTERFQFNPAVYFANSGAHKAIGYVVFTYTLPVWRAGP